MISPAFAEVRTPRGRGATCRHLRTAGIRSLIIATLSAALLFGADAQLLDHPEHGVRIPPGFRVTQFSTEHLANDIWSMTLNPRGQVVVSGAGYIRTLIDRDGDGRTDEAKQFSKIKGAMGLCFSRDGKELLATGEGWLLRYRDADLDGATDGPPERVLPFAAGEHGGHAIRQGPDGWWYVIGGNDAGIDARHVTSPESPIKSVEAGALVRLSPDLKTSQVIAHGFRNPYDFDFNAAGDIFTYDSDTERDFFLPWYSGCRIYHVRRGQHHGWRLPGYQRSFRRPDYLPDVTPFVADLGRGSPTGVAYCDNAHFPPAFRGGIFACDWTFGRIWFVRLARHGAGYEATPELFLEPVGTQGFAPTDVVVAEDGALFVSIGGRKTRGSVYRIEFDREAEEALAKKGSANHPPPVVRSEPGAESRPYLTEQPARSWDEARTVAACSALISTRSSAEAVTALRRLQLALGDWNHAQPSADAFVPWETALACPDAGLQRRLQESIRPHLASPDDKVEIEAARLLAMLNDDDPASSAHALQRLEANPSPTLAFHWLAVLAKLRGPLPDDAPARIAESVIAMNRRLEGLDRRPKQNWPVRLTEVLQALVQRVPELPEALVKAPGFPTPLHLPLVTILDREQRHRATERFFLAAKSASDFPWSPALAELLSELHDPAAAEWIRSRAPRPPAPKPLDAKDVSRWEQILKSVDWESGDAARGEKLFRERACANCHGSTATFGPDPAAAAARLSPQDLFRAIVFPSREMAEPYRATSFTLRDGSVRNGLVAFFSADGVIIQTGPASTERLAETEIVSRAPATESLMPTGLLEGTSPADLADLYQHLKRLIGPRAPSR